MAAKTNAQRQAARWARLTAAVAERDKLAAEVQRQAAQIERLETELDQALDTRTTPRCPTHGTDLACPRCYRED